MNHYIVSACCHPAFPVTLGFAHILCNAKIIENIKNKIDNSEWGNPYPFIWESDYVEEKIIPDTIYACIIFHNNSVEQEVEIFEGLPVNELAQKFALWDDEYNEQLISHIIVGFVPDSGIAVWCNGYKKAFLIINTIKMPLQIVRLMQQFIYRYLMLFEHWDENKEEWEKNSNEEIVPEFDYIEEALFDGTHDKLHDGGLMNYHQAGKPKKLAVRWHIKKSEYTAYFWFEDEEIRAIFDRFYGSHPETKTDFMIRIDAEQNKYELALYRYGLKEPQVISESAYQLIVFKNKFEYFRSENYDQPRGAWIW